MSKTPKENSFFFVFSNESIFSWVKRCCLLLWSSVTIPSGRRAIWTWTLRAWRTDAVDSEGSIALLLSDDGFVVVDEVVVAVQQTINSCLCLDTVTSLREGVQV